ncbi:hypothetical protein C8R42DRAFT_570274 [Lentinula raphanica]|nr:hypothetical protein C8R42DRAFT_570274 [Lentinula raphanica]
MEHILTECEGSGQSLVWSLAKSLWERKKSEWPEISFGLILSCGLVKMVDEKKKHLAGDSRLFRILVSESSQLIWKVRCERVIQGREISDVEVQKRWKTTIESRLELDCLLMNGKFLKGQLDKRVVERTWQEVLTEQDNLPEDWMGEAGVLVGLPTGIG